jgi:alpha-1,2-mannosyltransferase
LVAVEADGIVAQAGRTRLFSNIALALTLPPMIISISRVYALGRYYHSPFSVVHAFQYREIPHLLSDAGYSPVPPPKGYEKRAGTVYEPEWDYAPLETFDPKLRVCWGKEWYRYPSSFLVPQGVEVAWLRSDFDGAMPLNWWRSGVDKSTRWPRVETRRVVEGRFNDRNQPSQVEDAYVGRNLSLNGGKGSKPDH